MVAVLHMRRTKMDGCGAGGNGQATAGRVVACGQRAGRIHNRRYQKPPKSPKPAIFGGTLVWEGRPMKVVCFFSSRWQRSPGPRRCSAFPCKRWQTTRWRRLEISRCLLLGGYDENHGCYFCPADACDGRRRRDGCVRTQGTGSACLRRAELLTVGPARVVMGAAVFVIGVLGGAGVAMWVIPPV
jgi:hypothetical protein